jgi:hypothetical protein
MTNFDPKELARKIIASEYRRLKNTLQANTPAERDYLKVRSVIEGNSYPMLLTRKEIQLEQLTATGLWGER